MSGLKLFDADAIDAKDEGPVIFRIADFAHLRRPAPVMEPTEDDEALGRARILHANRRCPYCKHPVVQPVELNNGRYSRNRSRLPGSASVVGFQCDGCYQEWPA
ncbi:MAG: hypothetical protein IT428_30550 [Planctomycetaceae bacterium]|nr:hypothetical protein [Planctomycetaceae bacterium]